jgi:hypothetical protein
MRRRTTPQRKPCGLECDCTDVCKQDDYKALWQQMCERCDELDKKLAQQEAKDEPAAWMYPDDLKRFETSEAYAEAYSIEMVSPTQGETVPLYTTPPQRKPLTDEEIWDAYMKAPVDIDCHVYDLHAFARAIEAAHGIKGKA